MCISESSYEINTNKSKIVTINNQVIIRAAICHFFSYF